MKVLITGASSGLGREMAKILSSQYDEMVLVGRNEERLKEVRKEIEEISEVKVKTEVMDVSVNENCVRLHDENPDVDFLINNAGFGDYGPFTETSLENEIKMINTNISAYHILTKLYLIDMKKKNQGRILNVASIAGFVPGPLMDTYYATKAYVVRLSEGIREELRKEKSKVKISILCPGPVKTNFNKNANIGFDFYGVDCRKVSEYALNHLNRFYIVPVFIIRLSRIFVRFIPTSWTSHFIYLAQRSKVKKENHR